jgi:two-component system cell cycle sensor histidine kinase PleC
MAKNTTKSAVRKAGQNKKSIDVDPFIRLLADEQGNIAYVSKPFLKICGLKESDVKKKSLFELLHFIDPDEAIRSNSLFGQSSEEKWVQSIQDGNFDVKIINSDKVHTLAFSKVSRDKGQNFLIITENKDFEQISNDQFTETLLNQLQKKASIKSNKKKEKIDSSNEGELKHFLNMSNDVMSITDSAGKFIKVNNSFNRSLEYSDKELKELTFIDLIHADDRPQVRSSLNSLIHGETDEGNIIDFECRILTKSGAILWTEWRQKSSNGLVYSVGRDVTAIKKHEAALVRQERQLSEAQALGRMGHWYWKVGSDDIEWSDEIYRIFGVIKDKFHPTLDNVNDMLHKRDLGRLLQAFQRAIIEKNNYDMDFRVIRPDGEVRFIRCEGKCQMDAEGDVTALFGVMQDITERTLYERE